MNYFMSFGTLVVIVIYHQAFNMCHLLAYHFSYIEGTGQIESIIQVFYLLKFISLEKKFLHVCQLVASQL